MIFKLFSYYCLSQATFSFSWHQHLDFHCSCILSVAPLIDAPTAALNAECSHLPLSFEVTKRSLSALQCVPLFCLLSSRRSTLWFFNLHLSDSQCVGHRSMAVKHLGCLIKFISLDPTLKKWWLVGLTWHFYNSLSLVIGICNAIWKSPF